MVSNLNQEELLKAIENDKNADIFNLSFSKIKENKISALKELEFTNAEIKEMTTKLRDYMLVEEIDEVKVGRFMRWITLTDDPDDLYLNKGALSLEVKIIDDRVCINCRSFSGKIFNIKMDEVILFQKMSNQELVILTAMKYLEK